MRGRQRDSQWPLRRRRRKQHHGAIDAADLGQKFGLTDKIKARAQNRFFRNRRRRQRAEIAAQAALGGEARLRQSRSGGARRDATGNDLAARFDLAKTQPGEIGIFDRRRDSRASGNRSAKIDHRRRAKRFGAGAQNPLVAEKNRRRARAGFAPRGDPTQAKIGADAARLAATNRYRFGDGIRRRHPAF